MELFRLTTSSGSYDDYYNIDLGIYSSRELAEQAGEDFLSKVEEIKRNNPCPLSEETFYDIENYCGNVSEVDQNTYTQWMYGSMYSIHNLNLNINITIFELNKTDLTFLKNE